MPSVSTELEPFLNEVWLASGVTASLTGNARGHLAPWSIPGRCPARTILPRSWGWPEWKHRGSAPATQDAARTGVVHKERRCCCVPRCLGQGFYLMIPEAGWNHEVKSEVRAGWVFQLLTLHTSIKKISIMHFIIVVKHTQEGFYAGLIRARCNATLALLSHPLIHYIPNQELCKKKNIHDF